jgi:hypothetical protein
MFHLLQREEYRFIAVMAFRDSGKSTILNMTNVLWSILGKPAKKFAIVMSKTQEQAKNHFANIKAELENNEALREDFGPFTANEAAWNKLSLELEYHGAKILSVTRDQSVRGQKYGQYRPDLVICDDIEDADDEANGDGIYERFQSEAVPVGNDATRVIVLGNLVSERSFLMRLKKDIDAGRLKGVFRAYPFWDDRRKILWPGRYPDAAAVERLLDGLSSHTWEREYLLDATAERDYGRLGKKTPWQLAAEHEASKWSCRLRAAYRTWRREQAKAGEIAYQRPLVKPMRQFAILSPMLEEMKFNYWQEKPWTPHYEAYRAAKEQFADALVEIEKNT